MLATRLAQITADDRQGRDHGLIFRHFAVEDPQRIGHGAPLAIGAHLSHDRLQRLAQRVIVSGPVLRVSHGIDVKSKVRDAEPTQQSVEHFQQLCIANRVLAAG